MIKNTILFFLTLAIVTGQAFAQRKGKKAPAKAAPAAAPAPAVPAVAAPASAEQAEKEIRRI